MEIPDWMPSPEELERQQKEWEAKPYKWEREAVIGILTERVNEIQAYKGIFSGLMDNLNAALVEGKIAGFEEAIDYLRKK
jgi:hypothetical protein